MESPHPMRKDEKKTSKDLMTFCLQLIHHSQWKTRRRVLCGSNIEIYHYMDIAREAGIAKDRLDVDIMIIRNSRHAFRCSSLIPETYTGDIVRIYTGCIDTEVIHTGYARLMREKDLTELQPSDLHRLKNEAPMHGPAMIGEPKTHILLNKYSLSITNVDESECNNLPVSSYDQVYAVHSPYWPVEAAEWIARKRSHSFPSKSVIKQVVRYGCDFVQVSHNRLSNDGEWRFSFSKAEQIIIENWSMPQKIVYDTLWVLNKMISSSNFCSYYFKTLIFWACEEKPPEFWSDDSLVQSVSELLIEMSKCVKSKFCANYFIPGNNMLDHLIDLDLSSEIDTLRKISQSRQFITEIIDTCRGYEIQSIHVRSNIECLSWIKRAYVIYWRVQNDTDYYTDLFSTDLSTDLQDALYVELSDIYRGLCFHQESVSCVNASDKHIYSLKSESHLLLAVNLCKSQERSVIDYCSLKFVRFILTQFMFCGIEVSDVASNDEVQRKPNDESALDEQMSQIIEEKNVTLTWHRSMVMNNQMHTNVKIYKEWPGQCPTVNISWFIAKAYIANLYYTTQRDVSLTIKTCDDIIDVCKLSYMNEQFAERTFPVVLSTQWTSIYDSETQKMLGFYSLCSYVFDASSRSVYLGICPVQFALYLKLRSLKSQYDTDREDMNDTIIKNCIMDYIKHAGVCQCDELVNNGLDALTLVILKEIGAI